jgi:uncharacterized membrane protein
MIQAIIVLICYILIPVLIIMGFKRWSWMQRLGTVVIAYIIGVVASLCGVAHFDGEIAVTFGEIQKNIVAIAVPLAIPLMLFNCDFKLWTKALPKTAWALFGGIAAVVIAVVSGYFIFRNSIEEPANAAHISGMMAGIYTGGTMNFNALGKMLDVDGTTITTVLAVQMVITTPYVFFLLAGGYKIFRKILPYQDTVKRKDSEPTNIETADVENYHGMFEKKNLFGMLKGLGLSIAFLGIGAGISILTTGAINEMVVILTITTLAIIASFFKKVRELPKTFELGMFFILIFSLVISSMFNINSVNTESLYIGGFVLWIMLASIAFHLLFCRIGRVSGDLFCVSQVGLLCSPPFVPPVASAMKNKKVLISGLAVGLVGYAIGTYLGAFLAWVLA